MSVFDELRDYVIDRRNTCLKYRVDKFDPIFKQSLEDYEAKPKTRSAGTNLNLPEIYNRTEIILAHQLADFYCRQKSPLIPFAQVGQNQRKAIKIQMLWEHDARKMDFLLKMVPFFRSAILLGTGIVFNGWDRRLKEVTKEKPWKQIMGIPLGKKTMHYFEKIVDDPCLNVLDTLTFWVDPNAVSCDLQEARDCGYDRWMTKEEIDSFVASGDFSDVEIDWNRIGSRGSATISGTGLDTLGQDERKQMFDMLPDADDGKGKVNQMLTTEWYGEYDFGDGPVPTIVTIGDPGGLNLLLRPFKMLNKDGVTKLNLDGNSPYTDPETGKCRKPFTAMNFVPRDFCFWGRGVGEILYSENEEYQELRNLMLKNTGLAISGMMAYQVGMLQNENQLQITPGNKIATKGDPNKVMAFFKFPDITPNISYQVSEIKMSMDEKSGVDAIMRGSPANLGGRTPASAGEVAQRQGMSSRRFAFVTNLMMQQGPCKIAEATILNEKIFRSADIEIRTLKQAAPNSPMTADYEQVTTDDLQGGFDFFFVGDPLRQNENVLRNQQVAALGLMLNPLFFQPQNPDALVKLRGVVKLLSEAVELPTDEVTVTEEDLLQMQMEQMRQQAAQQAMTQAQGGQPGQQGQSGQNGMPPIPGMIPGQQTAGPQLPGIPEEAGGKGNSLPPIPTTGGSNAPIPQEGGQMG